jgi:1,4-dihydroxy-2-naphthoate octaprenyltransferase
VFWLLHGRQENDVMNKVWIKNSLGVARAPFLSLSLVTAFFIWTLAFFQAGLPSFLDSFLILIALLSAHIGVNALNEYQDFESGLDSQTRRTLFSGGSGTLPESPEFSESTRTIALACISFSGLIGLYFIFTVGIELLPVGVLGLWIVVNYTLQINRHPWLCLFAPGVGIGVLATLGGVYILSGYLSWVTVLLALGFALLLNNLLLLNQYPDKDADQAVGRRHVWIVYGSQVALALFRLQLLMVFGVVIACVALNLLPWFALLFLAIWWLVNPLWNNTQTEHALQDNTLAAMGKNVLLCHFYPGFLGGVLILARMLS